MSAEVISSQANRTKTWLLKLHRYPKRKNWNTEKQKTYKCLIFSQWSGVVRNDLGQKICNLVGVTETVTRKVDRQRDRETDKQTDRQTDQATGRQTNWRADRLIDSQTERQVGRQTDRQIERLTGRQTDRPTSRQRDWHTDRQADRQGLFDQSLPSALSYNLLFLYFYMW